VARDKLADIAIKMASGGMISIQNFMIISSGIQIIFRLLCQQFERLKNITDGGFYEAWPLRFS
jgi:hypothetical protein